MAGETSSERLHGLDALRGLAAMAVLCCHVVFLGKFPASHVIKNLAANFTLAVPMFFALSAFALAHRYSGNLGTWRDIRNYAISRYFRIAPLFYAVMCVWLCVWLAHGWFPSWDVLFVNATFLFGFTRDQYQSLVAAGWSLGVEMQFYVLLPILLLVIKDAKSAAALTVALFLFGYIADVNLDASLDDSIRRMTLIPNAAFFAAGLTVFYIYKSLNACDEKRRKQISIAALIAGLLVWAAAFATSDHFGGVAVSYPWRCFVALAFPFFIIGLALCNWKIISNGVTNKLGDWSYSIYLLHPLVIMGLTTPRGTLYAALSGEWWLALAISQIVVAAVTITLAALTHKYIEVPAAELGKRLQRRQPKLVAAE